MLVIPARQARAHDLHRERTMEFRAPRWLTAVLVFLLVIPTSNECGRSGADCWAVVWASCSSEALSIVLPFPSLWIVLHVPACTPYLSCLLFPSHLSFSGTTGEPKGVLLSHRAVVSDIASKYRYLIDSGYNVRLTIACVVTECV